jgi:hypothetical protein
MDTNIKKILDNAAGPLVRPNVDRPALAQWGAHGLELADLLEKMNGFFLIESTIHVFPWTSSQRKISIEKFNAKDGWRSAYWHNCANLLFFAADAFGNLFGIDGDGIVFFDAETGDWIPWASTFEEWAGKILADRGETLGYPAMEAWQDANGPIDEGKRLLPKKGLVFGGTTELANLAAVDLVDSLGYRGDLATQIKDLPDGATICVEWTGNTGAHK